MSICLIDVFGISQINEFVSLVLIDIPPKESKEKILESLCVCERERESYSLTNHLKIQLNRFLMSTLTIYPFKKEKNRKN